MYALCGSNGEEHPSRATTAGIVRTMVVAILYITSIYIYTLLKDGIIPRGAHNRMRGQSSVEVMADERHSDRTG